MSLYWSDEPIMFHAQHQHLGHPCASNAFQFHFFSREFQLRLWALLFLAT